MKNSTKLLCGAFALAIATAAVVSPALAYRGDPAVKGPDYSPERHEAMEDAFQNSNYEAWKELMNGKSRVTQAVNADNLARFAEAHNLAAEGDIKGAKTIRAELGLGLRNGGGRDHGQRENGSGQGFGQGNKSGLKDGSGQKGNASF